MFPLRIVAIDVGSNAIRFLGAEFPQPDRFTTIEQIRAPVRLGHATFATGRLDAAVMDAAVAALASFRERIDALGVVHYRAVATSAVRESANAEEFIARVRDDADIVLEVITSTEEARLVHHAVASRIDLGTSPWLLVDVGGGSVEVSVADAHRIRRSVSHAAGAVRLLEELTADGSNGDRFRRHLEEYLAPLGIPARGTLTGFIATGGNSEAVADLIGGPPDGRGVIRVPRDSLRRLIEDLSPLTPEQRIEKYGLRPDRADVILPGAVVYEHLCAGAGLDTILVPRVGVREGLVLDLAAAVAQPGLFPRSTTN